MQQGVDVCVCVGARARAWVCLKIVVQISVLVCSGNSLTLSGSLFPFL